jgi:SAM-dependent methyltransferase
MDKRARFWKNGYSQFAVTKEEEHEVNIYTRHGWYSRVKVFRGLIRQMMSDETLTKGMKTADLGCGSGMYSRIMKEAGLDPVSLDICFEMLGYAKKQDKEIPCIAADCLNLPFKNEVFDFAISFGVISIITEPEEFFHELKRTSKDQSIIMLMTLNKNFIANLKRIFHEDRTLPEDIGIIEYYPLKLKKRLQEIFPYSEIEFIPVFIFPNPFRFLQGVFQKIKLLHFTGHFLASAFILKIKRH